jgi:hypothetical protein
MSPGLAIWLVTWAAIVLLFLGLAAVLREVRLLRGLVTRDPNGFVAAAPQLRLGGAFASGSGPRIVLAVDSGCSLCLAITARLAHRTADGAAAGLSTVTLLTHEAPEVWADIAEGLPVVSDRESWRSISHLSPPVMMIVDGEGRVGKLVLPVRAEEIDGLYDEWRDTVQEGSRDVADVRADS